MTNTQADLAMELGNALQEVGTELYDLAAEWEDVARADRPDHQAMIVEALNSITEWMERAATLARELAT